MSPLLIVLCAFAATVLSIPLLRASAGRFRLLDHPNARSSHRRVTPRVGGLAIALGLAVALVVARDAWTDRPEAIGLLAGAALVALVGLLDDRVGLPPWPRLVVQVAAATLVVRATGGWERLPLPAPLDAPLAAGGDVLPVLWIVAVVNFFNFMDGIDGLAGLQGLITAGALASAMGPGDGAASTLAVALAAACAGFLPSNWSPASIFLGDAGSGLLGFILAALPLLAPEGRRSEAAVLVASSLFFFLADATTCLLRRVYSGQRWYEAHRQHMYQRWVDAGAGHAAVSVSLGGAAATTTALALAGWETEAAAWYWAALLLGAMLALGEAAVVKGSEQRAAETSARNARHA